MMVSGCLLFRPDEKNLAMAVAKTTAVKNKVHEQWKRATARGKRWGAPPPQYVSASGKIGQECPFPEYIGGQWVARHAPGAIECEEAFSYPRRTIEQAREVHTTLELRPHQVKALTAWANHAGDTGTIVAPCGAGKTIIGIQIASLAHCPVLIVAPSRDLVKQWKERIEEHTQCTPVVWSNQKRITGNITLATVQSLKNLSWFDAHEMGSKHGMVIVDECHKMPARTFAKVLATLPCRKRLGLTATPSRQDGKTKWIEYVCGPVIHRIEDAEVQALGYTLKPTINIVKTNDDEDWTQFVRRLSFDPVRNEWIKRIAVSRVAQGGTVLVLTQLVEHVEHLTDLIRAKLPTPQVQACHSKVKDRETIIQRTRDGHVKVMVATSIADEGLDIPRLDTLILCTPTKSTAVTEQRIGRILRPHPEKLQPMVFDIEDDAPFARGCLAKRRRMYKEKGWI